MIIYIIQGATARMGVPGTHLTKFIRGLGFVSIILLIFAYNSGVHFSSTFNAFRVSSSCYEFLAPMRAESKCSYLMVQARARWVSLHPSSFSANSESSFKFLMFFSVALGSQKNFFMKSTGDLPEGSLNLLTSVVEIPSRCLPVRKPPARGLHPTNPYLQFLNNPKYSTSVSTRNSKLYSFCAPIGLCRFSLSQIAKALKTDSASQLEVAQQKAFPASITS